MVGAGAEGRYREKTDRQTLEDQAKNFSKARPGNEATAIVKESEVYFPYENELREAIISACIELGYVKEQFLQNFIQLARTILSNLHTEKPFNPEKPNDFIQSCLAKLFLEGYLQSPLRLVITKGVREKKPTSLEGLASRVFHLSVEGKRPTRFYRFEVLDGNIPESWLGERETKVATFRKGREFNV